MRVAAADHHKSRGIAPDGTADKLTAFAVTFRGDGAGVDDVYVARIGKIVQGEATARKILGNRLGFILRDLTAERVQPDGVGCFRTDPPFDT